MIPQRVKLAGFLSYKDEQEIRFDGSELWMLSGTNGSGKSSIFDAVTYALFGHHRGGSQQAAELINKDSNTLLVEFDFTIDKVLYRIKRTLRRKTGAGGGIAGTQQILQFQPGFSDTDGQFEPIPDTHLKAKFEAWTRDKVGLTYETFTSSVLLLQGKAEKLLDSTPSGRAGVLASIVDLERYQKLHGKADEKRKELKGRLEGLSNQLAGLKDVTDEEYAESLLKIELAEQARTEAQERIEARQAAELKAREWAGVQTRLAAARDKLRQAEGLLGHAVEIEKKHARLRELKDVLPTLTNVMTERGRVSESERKTEKLKADREAATTRREQAGHALEQARKKLAALKKTLAADEAKQTELNARLRELSAVLEKVRQVEDIQSELKRLDDELRRLPADPAAAVRSVQEKFDRLTELGQAVPFLDRLHAERTELVHATQREAAARKDEARLIAEGKRAKEAFEKLQADLKAAKEGREAADQAAAEARALAKQAKELADEFATLTGAKTCRACGQALTPAHFNDEKRKRDLDAKVSERKAHDLAKSAADARHREEALARQEEDDRAKLAALREQYKDRSAEARQAAAEISRLTASCRQTFFALSDEFKEKARPTTPDDWTTVAYPERHELTALREQVAETDEVRRRLRQAQDTVAKFQALRAKADSAKERLEKVRAGMPPGDPAALRQEYAAKQSEDTSVANSIKAGKGEIARTETDVDRQARLQNELGQDLVSLNGKIDQEEAIRRQSHDVIDRLTRALPAAWREAVEAARLTDQLKWKQEYEGLQGDGIEAKFTQLQAARGGLESLRADITLVEGEADAFPPDARRPPEEVKAEVLAARKDYDLRNREFTDAQRHKDTLDGHRRQRADLGDQYKAADAEHNRYKLLAELLGRDRLQRHLVRQAERQIVDYANGVLDRLSGGQLFLKLVGTDDGASADKALDLECYNRVTGGAPIGVAFLSGSQRFRVAVSLALGIGQYASKQHRPIESVIIDEGFGCLDRSGRQVMIQELQNLKGHLHCILLVSHQEEFADAFPDGYRFALENGATRVNRFVR